MSGKLKFLKEGSSGKIFWLFFFCILPLINFPFLLDRDMIPKMICLLGVTFLLLAKSWKNKIQFISGRYIFLIFTFLLIFIIYSFFSTFKSLNKSEGLSDWIYLNYIFIFLFALCISGIIQLKNIFRFVPYTVFALFIVTLFQISNTLSEYGTFYIDYKISATLSNKNFLSETLLLLLPFTIGGIILEKNIVKRLNIIATGIILILIFLLQTSSAWVSVFLTSFIFMPIYLSLFKKNKISLVQLRGKKVLIVIFVFLLLTFFSVTILNKYQAFDNLKTKITYARELLNSDLSKIFNEEDDKNVNSVYERLFLWKNTIKLGAENKLTGIGLSNWKIMWPKYGVGGAYFLSSGVMHYEHPHNEYLLFYSELGLAGLTIFLMIFALIILYSIHLIKINKDDDDRKILLLMTAGIVSFLILSLFGYPFHRPYSAALLMVMIAVIIERGKKNIVKSTLRFPYRFSIIACLIFTVFMLNVSSARIKGEYYMKKALKEQSRGRFKRMSEQIQKAENRYFEFDLTGTPLNWYKGFAFHYSGSDSALFYFKKADLQNPYHIQTISDIGAILENKGKHTEAIKYFNRALSIIPRYTEAHFNLAIAYYNLNKPYEALMEINKSYMVGETYDNALKAILKLNAENFYLSGDLNFSKDKLRTCIDDVSFLKKLNQDALKSNVAFEKMLNDSCPNYK